MDKTLSERSFLNHRIVEAMNSASKEWGIFCLRYEIKDIQPPENVVNSMHQQVSAERKKRAEILESEGSRQAAINVAQGQKEALILESEGILILIVAQKLKLINMAEGEAKSIKLRAVANAEAISTICKTLEENERTSQQAVSLGIAEKYIEAFAGLAKQGNSMIIPTNLSDLGGMVRH